MNQALVASEKDEKGQRNGGTEEKGTPCSVERRGREACADGETSGRRTGTSEILVQSALLESADNADGEG